MSSPLRIRPRDIAMLQSLAEGRYLTVEALEWLHYPHWRRRYRAYLERVRQQEDDARYEPSSRIYVRLDQLRSLHWIGTIGRSLDLARQRFDRLPGAYCLLHGGAEVLSAMRRVPIEALWWEGVAKRSLQNVEHSVAIGTFYAALRCALEHHGKELRAWQGDHLLRAPASYDRVRVAGYREPLPVQPDATFLLDGVRYFVEMDRGTRPIRSWQEKARAYAAYRGSRALRERYGVADFRLLTVAPSRDRLERIAAQLAAVAEQPDPRALLLETRHLHPGSMRTNWQQMTAIQRRRRRVVDQLVEEPLPTLAAVALWETA